MNEPINIKIVIVGDGAIGKTCVMIRYFLLDIDILKASSIHNTPQLFLTTKRSLSKLKE